MIEAYGRRNPEQPTIYRCVIMEIVGAFDRPGNGFLAQVVCVGAPSGHAIAMRPQALAAPLDGGKNGRGTAL
jgi:hypothetical protein